jgi:hypothetical protein
LIQPETSSFAGRAGYAHRKREPTAVIELYPGMAMATPVQERRPSLRLLLLLMQV